MATADIDMDVDMDIDSDTGDARRSSIEKKPVIVVDSHISLDDDEPAVFERLPDEIIQQYALF